MKLPIFILTLLLLDTWCQAQRPTKEVIASIREPFVSILKTEPAQPVEGQNVIVYFQFHNSAANAVTGWIAAEMYSGTGQPGRSSVDWPVKELAGGQSIDGAVMVPATDAGTAKRLRVYFYETQSNTNGTLSKSEPRFVIAEQDINVAALISFHLESFTINHTRARTEDTDYSSLYAAVNEQPAMQPVSIFMGNFQDGTYPIKGTDLDDKQIEKLETGPIAIVPGMESDLRITYSLYNGGGIYDRREFMKGYANATANPELFHGSRSGDNQAIEVLKKLVLPLSAIGACDGLVAVKNIVIPSSQIFANNNFRKTNYVDHFNTEEYASQAGCGNTSDYTVRSSISRLSSSGQSTTPSLVFTDVNKGTTVELNEPYNSTMPAYATWQKVEVIDDNGNFSATNDPATGYIAGNIYHAPADISRPLLVIIRGEVTSPKVVMHNMSNGRPNEPLKPATAIIQLVPGVTLMKPPPPPDASQPPQQPAAQPVIRNPKPPPTPATRRPVN